ncbi:YceI family protein [Leptospira ryugenii]|nr:YceI family protein [Leptospira ryugenii]
MTFDSKFSLSFLLALLVFFLAPKSTLWASEIWTVSSGKVSFVSNTELETIVGEGDGISGTFDPKTKNLLLEVDLSSIQTKNSLQTSHLHDNYFEIEKYPTAKFIGFVSNYREEGEVIAFGNFFLHGVKKEKQQFRGFLSKKENGYELLVNFNLALDDYNIQIPKLVLLKVNRIVQVKLVILWQN